MAIPVSRISVNLKLDGEKYVDLNEGDIVRDLVYSNEHGTFTIDEGAVRVLIGSTKASNTVPEDCPPSPYLHQYVTVSQICIDCSEKLDADLVRIPVSSISSIGEVHPPYYTDKMITVGPGPEFRPLDEIVNNAEEGTVILLEKGEYNTPLRITKNLSLISHNGAVMKGALTIGDEADINNESELEVIMTGLDLTGGATITVNAAKEFRLVNCKFHDHELTAKTMPIAVKYTGEMKLVIANNSFGENSSYSYNLIDVYAKLVNHSFIAGNKFARGCCSHNQISLYGLADDATIHINGNYAEYSANLVRIGFKGNPKGTVVMNDNIYDFTEEHPYDGMFFVQPYGKQTESFADLMLIANDTVFPAGTQIGYLYAGKNDTPFTDLNKPTCMIDNEIVELPDLSPAVLEALAAAEAANASDPEPADTEG